MLEIQRIRNDKDAVIQGLQKRHFDAAPIIDELLKADEEWRNSKTELESVSAQMNKISKEIGILFREGKAEEANAAKAKTAELKALEGSLKEKVDTAGKKVDELMYQLPNVPNELVKAGKSEEDNENVFEAGAKPEFTFKPLPHWELADKHNLIDFELGVKITGAGFPTSLFRIMTFRNEQQIQGGMIRRCTAKPSGIF